MTDKLRRDLAQRGIELVITSWRPPKPDMLYWHICDWGDECGNPAIGYRWDDELQKWLVVCRNHQEAQ